MTILIATRNDIETVLSHQLAPELTAMGSNAVYVVLASEHDWSSGERWYAEYHPLVGSWCRELVGDRWQGPGIGWVLDDAFLRRRARGSDSRLTGLLWANCVHEAIHAIRRPPSINPDSSDDQRLSGLLRDRYFAGLRTGHPSQKTAGDQRREDNSHDVAFARMAIHLARRLWHRHGVSVEPTDILPNQPGRLAMAELWWLIRREIVPLMDRPLTEIASMPIPDLMQREWDSAANVAAGQSKFAAKAA